MNQTMPATKTYPYKHNPWLMICAVLLTIAASVTFLVFAITNDRALIINHIAYLSTPYATIFYGAMSITCFIFTFLAGMMTYHGLTTCHEIKVTSSEIFVPKHALSKNIIQIPFKTITQLKYYKINGEEGFTIYRTAGKVHISCRMFKSPSDFNDVMNTIKQHI